MKLLKVLPLIAACFFLGCNAKHSIVPGVNLNRYAYVSMPSLSDFSLTPAADQNDISAVNRRLSALFQKKGLHVLEQSLANSLPAKESYKILTLKYQCSQTSGVALVSLSLYDNTGREVFTCSAEDGTGWSVLGRTLNASNRAFDQFAKNYSGYDPNLLTEFEALREKTIQFEESNKQIENLQKSLASHLKIEEDSKKLITQLEKSLEQKTAQSDAANSKLEQETSLHQQTKKMLDEKTRQLEESKQQIENLKNDLDEHLQIEEDSKKLIIELEKTLKQKSADLDAANLKLKEEITQHELTKAQLKEKSQKPDDPKQKKKLKTPADTAPKNKEIDLKLLQAVENLDVDQVRNCLDAGANPNCASGDKTPYSLLYETLGKTISWGEKERKRNTDLLELLSAAGAKVQPTDKDLLYFPIVHKCPDAVELLLKCGANPNENIAGKTPVELAEECEYTQITDILIKYGGLPIPVKDAVQLRFVDAARRNDIIKMEQALNNGADINGLTKQGESALTSALAISANPYSCQAVVYLLKNGANPNLQGRNEQEEGLKGTPLHILMLRNGDLFSGGLDSEKKYMDLLLKQLIKAGADIDAARYSDGKTPLHIAVIWKNFVGAKLLIDAGAKNSVKDNNGKTPLDYAQSADMIDLLKSQTTTK